MSQNRFKEKPKEEEAVAQEAPKKKSSMRASRNFIRFLSIFRGVSRNQVVHSMPFILFITGILIAYIANSYYAEGLVRDINKAGNDVKEKRAEYISVMSDLMNQKNQSVIASQLSYYGIKESKEPPVTLSIPKNINQ